MALNRDTARRRVTVLGATGSIGRSTLDLIARQPGRFEVEALTANRDVEGLAAAARATGCRFAAIADPGRYGALREQLAGSTIEVAAGPAAMIEAAERPADWVMSAIVGAAGLAPTLAAVRRGVLVALATKESLVCAGALLMAEVKRAGARLLPVDSEHNAIFQALRDEAPAGVEKLVLTASGGPFRDASREVMARATPAEAIAHPNWSMGAKISVDSATMMNKGLELIEAHYLFEMPEDRIEILVHPESIIHSLVAFRDGSMLAQLGQPDMRIPIAYTLGWPERLDVPLPRLDLCEVAQLNFRAPDAHHFPALRLARDALQAGGSAPTVLNAANELAVASFLAGRIGFLEIAEVVERTLEAMAAPPATDLDHIVALDQDARARAGELIALIPRTRAG